VPLIFLSDLLCLAHVLEYLVSSISYSSSNPTRHPQSFIRLPILLQLQCLSRPLPHPAHGITKIQ
jgi:hypothetical protein